MFYSVTEPMRFPVLSTRHGAELPTAFIDNGFRLCAVAQLPDRSELPRRGTLPHTCRLPLFVSFRSRSRPDAVHQRYNASDTRHRLRCGVPRALFVVVVEQFVVVQHPLRERRLR